MVSEETPKTCKQVEGQQMQDAGELVPAEVLLNYIIHIEIRYLSWFEAGIFGIN